MFRTLSQSGRQLGQNRLFPLFSSAPKSRLAGVERRMILSFANVVPMAFKVHTVMNVGFKEVEMVVASTPYLSINHIAAIARTFEQQRTFLQQQLTSKAELIELSNSSVMDITQWAMDHSYDSPENRAVTGEALEKRMDHLEPSQKADLEVLRVASERLSKLVTTLYEYMENTKSNHQKVLDAINGLEELYPADETSKKYTDKSLSPKP